MSGYVKIFIVEDKNNNLMSFLIDNEKLLEKNKSIWTNISDLKNIRLNALPIYDERYIKAKIRTYREKVYTNLLGLNIIK